MDHFLYKNGTLHAEDVAITDIAAAVGTPFYVYSSATLTRHYRLFTEALAPLPHLVCFAIKSLSNVAVLKTLGDLGAGMDVVSIGEYLRAKAAGVPGERIVFSGIGKTRGEIRAALEGGLRQFNVESEPEMRAISDIAVSMGVTAPVAIRVNPDVDAKTHEKIATGKSENKFGIPIARASDVYAEAARLPGLQVVGIDVVYQAQINAAFWVLPKTGFSEDQQRLGVLGPPIAMRATRSGLMRLRTRRGAGLPEASTRPRPAESRDPPDRKRQGGNALGTDLCTGTAEN